MTDRVLGQFGDAEEAQFAHHGATVRLHRLEADAQQPRARPESAGAGGGVQVVWAQGASQVSD